MECPALLQMKPSSAAERFSESHARTPDGRALGKAGPLISDVGNSTRQCWGISKSVSKQERVSTEGQFPVEKGRKRDRQ